MQHAEKFLSVVSKKFGCEASTFVAAVAAVHTSELTKSEDLANYTRAAGNIMGDWLRRDDIPTDIREDMEMMRNVLIGLAVQFRVKHEPEASVIVDLCLSLATED